MICDLCRSNLAKIKVSRYVGGRVINLSLCEDCYQNLDATLLTMIQNGAFTDTPCPQCGTAYNTIKATGKFGCPTCYTHFKDRAAGLLQNIHGGAVHKGKRPDTVVDVITEEKSRLHTLKEQLQQCIINQEFEQAAVLRDQIRELEAQNG